MILGGWQEVEMIDGGSVNVRIPPGLEANKFLKVKERGYWKDRRVYYRGDCLLQVIPLVQKIEDMKTEDAFELFLALKTHLDKTAENGQETT